MTRIHPDTPGPSSWRDPLSRSSPQSSLSRPGAVSAFLWAVLVLCGPLCLLTVLPCVLWRGFRHGDWTAFTRYRLPDGRDERFDWLARTGRYAWRRELEEQELHGHDPDFP